MQRPKHHPPKPAYGQLRRQWHAEVQDLCRLSSESFSPGQEERHRLYSLLLMALVRHYWNGNKYGREGQRGKYHGRTYQLKSEDDYRDADYLGHNIACLAVDKQGAVMDFDFNHNDLLRSSVEHAESRLIRRLFSLTQIDEGWATRPLGQVAPFVTLLKDVTVYTSLESCSQCSGIMALGAVKEVVFLQRDPGQNSIGNILRNLSRHRDPEQKRDFYYAPLPIPADTFGFPYFEELVTAYDLFRKTIKVKPFFQYRDGSVPEKFGSITSFLCTDKARATFQKGHAEFLKIVADPRTSRHYLGYPDWPESPGTFSNLEVVDKIRRFFQYATTNGHRGTPHKL